MSNKLVPEQQTDNELVPKQKIDKELNISKNLRLALTKKAVDLEYLDQNVLSRNKLLTKNNYELIKAAIIRVRSENA